MVSVNGVVGEACQSSWLECMTYNALGQRVYAFSNSDYWMFHANALGSTTMSTDQNAAVQRDQLFYPWGQMWKQTGGWFWVRYAKLDFPTIVGSYAALHRDYNPTMGRWLTPDPGGMQVIKLDNPQTWNMYAYVTNNPETLNDPLGLWPTWIHNLIYKNALPNLTAADLKIIPSPCLPQFAAPWGQCSPLVAVRQICLWL